VDERRLDLKETLALPSRPMGEGERGGTALILMTLVAAPVALGFETLLRKLLFPPEFEELRALFSPTLTIVSWVLVLFTAVLGVAGLLLQQKLAARNVAKIPEPRRTPARVQKAELGAFLLAASVPQIPAILATFCFMWGAALTPTLVAIGVVTAAIIAQAVRAR
jgi:hypothetical protein